MTPAFWDFFSIRKTRTLLGWTRASSSLYMDFSQMMILDTFMPPPVLPAQAPTNIRPMRMVLENWGHTSKSTVENPVVVMMDPTWKAAWWKAWKMLPKDPRIFTVIRATAAAMIPRYTRASSQEKASLNRLTESR